LTDRIELRGLRVSGHHGADPGEQDEHQPFEIDLDLSVGLAAAGAFDRLDDTVDYGAVCRAAAVVVSGERWQLLERIAERVAEVVLACDGRIGGVTVSVRKLRPPVDGLATAGVRIERWRRRVFLGLGANLGDREAALRAAVAGLPDVVGVSALYETEPLGGPAGQPPYLNAVVELSTALPARALLAAGQRLEAAAGRDRGAGAVRHGPRPLDVDVLWIDGETVDEPDLTIPHPRLFQRRFVLAPLADLAPDVVPQGWEHTAVGTVRPAGRL